MLHKKYSQLGTGILKVLAPVLPIFMLIFAINHPSLFYLASCLRSRINCETAILLLFEGEFACTRDRLIAR
jgi:hypothetical protein